MGLIEGRQGQWLKRLEGMIDTVRELGQRVDRYFVILLSCVFALLSSAIGGFITLVNMIASIP